MKAQFIGWAGNNSIDPQIILEDIVTLEKINTLPSVTLKLKSKEEIFFQKAAVRLTRVRYPLGRCLEILYPRESANATLNGIVLTWTLEKQRIDKISYVVHLMGRNSGFKNKYIYRRNK